MEKFINSTSDEMSEVNGGLLIGALAGGYLGAVLGAAVGTVGSIANGGFDAKVVYKSSVAFGLTGAAIGAYTPV